MGPRIQARPLSQEGGLGTREGGEGRGPCLRKAEGTTLSAIKTVGSLNWLPFPNPLQGKESRHEGPLGKVGWSRPSLGIRNHCGALTVGWP